MEVNLKRKHPGISESYSCKKLKIGLPYYRSERTDLVKLRPLHNDSPIKSFHANPMPHYPNPLAHSVSFTATNPLNLSFHTQHRAIERAKFDSQVKINQEYKKQNLRALREIQEKAEVKAIKENMMFKARPLPDYKSPLKPAKSLKKLTIPIEKVFQTDLRAFLRNRSQSVHRNIDGLL